MEEKFDLFELTVKRGLEHYEMPLEQGAWNEFEKVLHGPVGSAPATPSSSFFGKFGLAAAVLAGAVFVINYSSGDSEHAHEAGLNHMEHSANGASLAESGSALDMDQMHTSGAEAIDAESYGVANGQENTQDGTASADNNLAGHTSNVDLSSEQIAALERINNKLQDAAEQQASYDSTEKIDKEMVTRYVGDSFKLDAASDFSPNGDGFKDFFLPSALTAEDVFLMKIVSQSGRTIFTTNDIENPWNGLDNQGFPMDEGKYTWEVIKQDGTNRKVYRGQVELKL